MSEDTAIEIPPTYATNGIAIDNLSRFWPKGQTVPALITDIATLIAPWPWGIISHVYITASRPNDYFIENGADLWNQFGMFMGFANGTEYAMWYYDGCPAGAEPIVSFGDEGELRILAPNLKAFFQQWAAGEGVGWLDPFDYDATPELLAERQSYGAKLLAIVDAAPTPPPAPTPPDITQFIEDFDKAARAKNDADPTLRAIATLLASHFPTDENNSRGVSFGLKAAGDTIEVETTLMEPDYTEYAPLPEREALIPLIRQARLERAAAQNDGRGLWVSGNLYLQFGGHAFISGDWA
jgi:hypothetical protein